LTRSLGEQRHETRKKGITLELNIGILNLPSNGLRIILLAATGIKSCNFPHAAETTKLHLDPTDQYSKGLSLQSPISCLNRWLSWNNRKKIRNTYSTSPYRTRTTKNRLPKSELPFTPTHHQPLNYQHIRCWYASHHWSDVRGEKQLDLLWELRGPYIHLRITWLLRLLAVLRPIVILPSLPLHDLSPLHSIIRGHMTQHIKIQP